MSIVLIHVDPTTLGDTHLSGPHCIIDDWVSLKQVGFSCVDAALPNPGAPNQVFFFFQDRYVLVEVCSPPGARDDKLIDGPKNTLIEFANLQGPQFGTPDVTLQVARPADNGYYWVYFFKNTKWLQFSFKPGANGHGVSVGEVLGGAKDIGDYWKSLKKVGFKTMDMAMDTRFTSSVGVSMRGYGIRLARLMTRSNQARTTLETSGLRFARRAFTNRSNCM